MRGVDSITQRAFESGNPVVHGNRATLIWKGESAPQLISDLNDWDPTRRSRSFKPISSRLESGSAPTIWACSLTLPRDAYLEYAFYDPLSEEQILDPLNRHTVSNGMGGRNNYFYMPETMPSPYPMRRADVRGGRLSRHRVGTDFFAG